MFDELDFMNDQSYKHSAEEAYGEYLEDKQSCPEVYPSFCEEIEPDIFVW